MADLISRPPAWTVQLAGPGPGVTNVEGVAFSYGGHDLNLLAENRDVYYVPTRLRALIFGRQVAVGVAGPREGASRATRAPMTP